VKLFDRIHKATYDSAMSKLVIIEELLLRPVKRLIGFIRVNGGRLESKDREMRYVC
jgi:hypothetical protein